MSVQRFKKKPLVVEAVQLTHENKEFLWEWLGKSYLSHSDDAEDASWLEMEIATLEGSITASHHDYIIKGIAGEFYPCKPDIFEASYDKVEEPTEIEKKYGVDLNTHPANLAHMGIV